MREREARQQRPGIQEGSGQQMLPLIFSGGPGGLERTNRHEPLVVLTGQSHLGCRKTVVHQTLLQDRVDAADAAAATRDHDIFQQLSNGIGRRAGDEGRWLQARPMTSPNSSVWFFPPISTFTSSGFRIGPT